MIDMLEDYALPTGQLARVARRGDRYFVVVGPRRDPIVLGPDDQYADALRRVCRLLSARVLS